MGDALDFTVALDKRFMGWASGLYNGAPPVDEEYFEWADLLEALRTSDNRFVMLELGAGYGRWSLRAGLVAQRLGKTDVHIRMVEAEPQHAQWAREAIVANK